MANYVNEERFLKWYEENYSGTPAVRNELLEDALAVFVNTGEARYILPPEKTRSGKEESYTYRVENLGCCGASTIFVYF